MNNDDLNEKEDLLLEKIQKHDLYPLSVGDLEERIAAMKTEIARCEAAIEGRSSTRAAAEDIFRK